MTGFATLTEEVTIGPNSPTGKWELKLLTIDQLKSQAKVTTMAAQNQPSPAQAHAPAERGAGSIGRPRTAGGQEGRQDHKIPEAAASGPAPSATNTAASTPTADQDTDERAANGFLINGSAVNGASSPFAQSFAFGNNRGGKGLYNGGIGVILDNSALDARPYSLTGQNTPKPSYNRITGIATLGGPLRISHLLHGAHDPNIFAAYEWTRSVNDSTQSALVPTAAERGGDFSQVLNTLGQPVQIFNPSTGQAFSGNLIPQINPQAQALLNYYPLPSFSGNSRYNYQTGILSSTHQDALQSHFNEYFNPKNQLYGMFAYQSTRTATPNIFGFLDNSDLTGINTNLNWSHRLSQRVFITAGYQFSRLATLSKPFWDGRANVSGQAGIMGNNQDPANWGPPTLAFSSGIAGLSDAQFSRNRNQTDGASYSLLWSRYRHNIKFGGDFRRRQFNYLAQQDPRGVFTFTGAATAASASGTGADFADFLLGLPDTSAIAFGNADKYFRESMFDGYAMDDWRINPQFTLNWGLRWEYGAPITELYGRLVNLDIAPGFAAVAPVLENNPVGSLTHDRYPSSLIQPDKRGYQPRVAIAWRPISGSSTLVRASYGIYDDTSVYLSILFFITRGISGKEICFLRKASTATSFAPFNTAHIDASSWRDW